MFVICDVFCPFKLHEGLAVSATRKDCAFTVLQHPTDTKLLKLEQLGIEVVLWYVETALFDGHFLGLKEFQIIHSDM